MAVTSALQICEVGAAGYRSLRNIRFPIGRLTLRYLGLAGALLGYRLPAFIALNGPETSLHPDLLEPLARMIMAASARTQIWVVTHSERLAVAFAAGGAVAPRTVKRNGETWIEGLRLGGNFEQDEDD